MIQGWGRRGIGRNDKHPVNVIIRSLFVLARHAEQLISSSAPCHVVKFCQFGGEEGASSQEPLSSRSMRTAGEPQQD